MESTILQVTPVSGYQDPNVQEEMLSVGRWRSAIKTQDQVVRATGQIHSGYWLTIDIFKAIL